MTTELKTEMRAHVVGPCDEAQKAELRTELKRIGEPVETLQDHPWFPLWKYSNGFEEWIQSNEGFFTPTISFPAFKAKYLTK